jgi:hypothetical protein
LQTAYVWNKAVSGTATDQTPLSLSGVSGTLLLDLGSTYVQTMSIDWYLGPIVSGHVELLYTKYQTTFNGTKLPVTDACYPQLPATGTLSDSVVTVDQWVEFDVNRFPATPKGVSFYIDGVYQIAMSTDVSGNSLDAFPVKPRPMGQHTIRAYRYGRSVTKTFTIVPRIKVRPHATLTRGQTVDISLRGYAAHETVNIRWKKGTSFAHLAYVTTSSTGSANINVTVPKWVPDGSTSVRGDGSFGHAQTNAVMVAGGPFSSSTVKPSTTPTPTETATPSPSPTTVQETSTPEPTSTVAPTEQPATPEATTTETVTEQPTESATPSVEPTEDASSPTETPTIEPTATPSETPHPAATESAGESG